MKEEMNQHDWTAILQEKSADESWILLNDIVLQLMDKYIPKVRLRDDGKIPPPWLNNTIRQKSKEKWSAYWEMRREKDDRSRKKYAKIRNQLKWLVRKTIKEYEKSVHSQKQLVQWAVYVTAEFYA